MKFDHISKLIDMALAAHCINDLDEAEQLYRQAISLQCTVDIPYINLAQILHSKGMLEESEHALILATKRCERKAKVLIAYSLLMYDQLRIAEAIELAQKAISLEPSLPEPYIYISDYYRAYGDSNQALESAAQAVQLNNGDPRALIAYSACLIEKGEYTRALSICSEALSLDSRLADAYLNAAHCSRKLGKTTKATQYAMAARRFGAKACEVYTCLAEIEYESGNSGMSILLARKALEGNNQYQPARFILAIALLRTGSYRRGWELYRSRWDIDRSFSSQLRQCLCKQKPEWSLDVSGPSKIFVYFEQGIGDQIMFLATVLQLVGQGHTVSVLCDKRLAKLFQRSLGQRVTVLSSLNDLVPCHDFHISAGDLCGILREKPGDFYVTSKYYLKYDIVSAEGYRKELEKVARGRKIIGICWKSFTKSGINTQKSISLLDLLSAFPATRDVMIVNLQYGPVEEELQEALLKTGYKIYSIPSLDIHNNLDDLTSAIHSVDILVTISSVACHISGATGTPTHLLLPYSSDWRWGENAENCLWYESVLIHRQSCKGFWDKPLQSLKNAIAQQTAP